MNFHLQGQKTDTKIACTMLCQSLVRTPLLAAYSHTYKRHRPEQTILYQLVERHYPEFLEQLSHQGKSLPKHVEKEFEEVLKCVRLEHGFLRVVCEDCKHKKLVAFSCKKRLSLINPGKVKYELKAPYSNGTTTKRINTNLVSQRLCYPTEFRLWRLKSTTIKFELFNTVGLYLRLPMFLTIWAVSFYPVIKRTASHSQPL